MGKTDRAKEYVKDVVTFQKAKENFFKNDGVLSHWFAHGATELANMTLHGHPAPVYAGSVSPPDQVGSLLFPGKEMAVAPSVDIEPAVGTTSFLSKVIDEIQNQPEVSEPELEIDQ